MAHATQLLTRWEANQFPRDEYARYLQHLRKVSEKDQTAVH